MFTNKKEMSLKDIQAVSLDIMTVIDNFCHRQKIEYSLEYGALIGAIRHKGCIPWDDDIDIIITRPEYQKLLRLFNEDEYVRRGGVKMFAPELGNCYFPIARICDIKRTKVHRHYQWTDGYTGVWIDIFVMDGIPNNGTEKLRAINHDGFLACLGHVRPSTEIGLIQNLKNLKSRLLYGRLDRTLALNRYLDEISKISWESSQEVCNFCSPYKTDIHRKQVFDSYVRVPFEDREFCIIVSYDEYLRNIYGDYMQLPPEEQRKRGHLKNTYLWI